MEQEKNNVIDITYKIVEEKDGKRSYTMNNEKWEFVNPSEIVVGSHVWFDPNGLERNGIVTNIRKGDFTYYDVGFPDTLALCEVADFQVYKVEKTMP